MTVTRLASESTTSMLCSISRTVARCAIVRTSAHELRDLGFREALGWLVENEQLRLRGERHRQLEQPLVPIGELVGLLLRLACESRPIRARPARGLPPRFPKARFVPRSRASACVAQAARHSRSR
jgi:hypothetical protein